MGNGIKVIINKRTNQDPGRWRGRCQVIRHTNEIKNMKIGMISESDHLRQDQEIDRQR